MIEFIYGLAVVVGLAVALLAVYSVRVAWLQPAVATVDPLLPDTGAEEPLRGL